METMIGDSELIYDFTRKYWETIVLTSVFQAYLDVKKEIELSDLIEEYKEDEKVLGKEV